MTTSNLVGAKDIATRADVKKDTVMKWRARYESFPKPVAVISDSVPVWDWLEVAAWLESRSTQTRTGTRVSVTPPQ